MKQPTLTKTEKRVLRHIFYDIPGLPSDMPISVFSDACRTLQSANLIDAAFVEGGKVEATRMTPTGKSFIYNNPRLLNPINWQMISVISSIIAIIISIIAIIIACSTI